MNKKVKTILIINAIVLTMANVFYWGVYRPQQIRKACSAKAYNLAYNKDFKYVEARPYREAYEFCLNKNGL